MYRGTFKPAPPSNKKKIIIIASIIAVLSLSALGGLVYKFASGGTSQQEPDDPFGPPRRTRQWNDNNLPNPNKQTGKEIVAYMDSADFKNLSSREQFMYMREGGEKALDYQMDTYFSLPDEKQKTALLDNMIDRMQAQRAEFERNRPPDRPRRRDPNDVNDPNSMQNRFARAFNPSNMRARSEQGTPTQRAQRQAFFAAMAARMQARGITMGGPGGGGGRGFGGGGGGGRGRGR